MKKSLSIAICAVALIAAAPAQETYGFGIPGAAGNIPEIASNQAWIGRSDFEITVSNVAGFTQAFFLISPLPDNTSLFGIPIWVDLATVFETSPGMLPFDITDMNGDGTFTAPLPNIPPLVGFKIYGQSLTLDIDPNTGLPSATGGVEITFTMPPQVAVTTSQGGSTDDIWLVNPETMSLDFQGGNNFTNNAYGNTTYTDDGRHAYLASSITGSLTHIDLTGATPAFSTLTTFPVSSGNSGCWNTFEDEENDLLWTLATNDSGERQLFAIDINLSSPSYGSQVAQTTTIPSGSIPEIWALSNDGKTAAVFQTFGNAVYIIDTDPSSVTFLSILQTLNVPGNGFFNSTAQFSPDDNILYVAVVPLGGPNEIARYDFTAGAWIDHNPSTAFIVENIGAFSIPPVTFGNVVSGMDVAPDGDSIFLSASGDGQVQRVDFAAGTWSSTLATGASPSQVWELDLNPDGTILAGPSWNPPVLNFWDADSMAFLFSVPLPGGFNIYNVNWR